MTVHLGQGVTVSRPAEHSFGIDDLLIARARASIKKQAPDPIVAVEPKNTQSRFIVGVLREISRSGNPVKVFELPDTVVSNAMLGPIGAQAVGRITVHAPSPAGGPLESITTWIPLDLLSDSRIVKGITVALRIDGVHVLGRGYSWFCDDFEVVG